MKTMVAPLGRFTDRLAAAWPGVLVASLVAISARFIAEHYGAPAMLMALLGGIALNFLSENEKTGAGINFGARTILRFGVAVLGARVSLDLLTSLGWDLIGLLVFATCVTILFGVFLARFIGQGPRFAILTAGAVAICGASAAMAIAAVLPKDDRSERNLLFTVLGVTVLSTVAMIVYPIFTSALAFDEVTAGIFIGATIHDVAQVVGAGFSVSEATGETSTLVKLIRVSFLAPIVVVIALWWRHSEQDASQGHPPIIPGFVLGFLALAVLNSFGLIPEFIREFLSVLSGWALLIAIAAVGLKTDLRNVMQLGAMPIILITAETLFLAGLVLAGILILGIGG